MSTFHLKQTSHRTRFVVATSHVRHAGRVCCKGTREHAHANHSGFEFYLGNPVLLRCEKMDASIVVHWRKFFSRSDDDPLGEDTTLSQCGDEGNVSVARQTRSVFLSKGAGE